MPWSFARDRRRGSHFEDKCLEAGVSNETIHGKDHESFWGAAQFYYTQGVSVEEAVRRFCDARGLGDGVIMWKQKL